MVVTHSPCLAVKLQTPGSVRQNPGELVACDLCAAPSQVLQIRAQISVATTHTSSPSPSGSSTSTTSTEGGALRTALTRCPPLIDPHSSSALNGPVSTYFALYFALGNCAGYFARGSCAGCV